MDSIIWFRSGDSFQHEESSPRTSQRNLRFMVKRRAKQPHQIHRMDGGPPDREFPSGNAWRMTAPKYRGIRPESGCRRPVKRGFAHVREKAILHSPNPVPSIIHYSINGRGRFTSVGQLRHTSTCIRMTRILERCGSSPQELRLDSPIAIGMDTCLYHDLDFPRVLERSIQQQTGVVIYQNFGYD